MELTLDTRIPRAAQAETPAKAPRKLSALGAVAALSAAGLGGILIYLQAVLFKELVPPMAVLAAVALIIAAAIAAAWRWTPALGTLLSVLLTLGLIAPAAKEIAVALGSPSDALYPVLVIFFPLAGVALVSGIAATVQNYRTPSARRRAPRGLAAALAATAGLSAGALLIGVFPRPAATAGVSPEVLASLPAVQVKTFAFTQTELRVKVGETVALRLENGDVAGHSFDIDELNVHAPIPAGQTGLALFKPSAPGTYTFYCAPHYDKATGQGMKGTLIVE